MSSLEPHWVEPRPEGMLDTLSRIVWHHDAPTPARGRYAQWFTYREAGRYVKVVLVGQGADELLAGYDRFRVPHLVDRWRRGGGSVGPTSRILTAAAGLRHRTVSPLVRRFGLPVWPAARVLDRDFARSQARLDPAEFYNSWLCPDVERPFASHLNNALWGEFHRVGLPELLHSDDALSMAFSVEARPAFLDHRLVEEPAAEIDGRDPASRDPVAQGQDRLSRPGRRLALRSVQLPSHRGALAVRGRALAALSRSTRDRGTPTPLAP